VRCNGSDAVIQVSPHGVVGLEPRAEFSNEIEFADRGQADNHRPVDVHFAHFDVEKLEVVDMFVKDYDFNFKNVANVATIVP